MALSKIGDGEQIGDGNINEGLKVGVSGGTIGLYGATPVAQRAYSSAVHATSALATSSAFGATQLAAIQEIQKTLTALGVWASA
jgi:hypothetical protein